jgi:pimeloyl-ACP methyl ester carboxylesterase
MIERIEFANSRKGKLVGDHFKILLNKMTDAVIIMCHGFTSDRKSKGRFERLSKGFNESGFDALAFDFSGCGESSGEKLTMENETDDLSSAINFVKLLGYKKIALYGHSLGSLICLRAYTPEIITLVLSGALTDSMTYDWEEFYSKEQMAFLKEHGYFIQQVNSAFRRESKIDKTMLDGFEKINQVELLSRIKCPTLIIHGNNGKEENQLLERSQRGLKLLPQGSKLEVIDGSSHSQMEHYDELIKVACAWFKKNLN